MKNELKSNRRARFGTVRAWVITLGVLGIGLALIALAARTGAGRAGKTAPEPALGMGQAINDAVRLDQVMRNEVDPVLNRAANELDQAADRAVRFIHDRFEFSRCGITPFCRDLTGCGTRFGVASRKIREAYRRVRRRPHVDEVRPYVEAKFRKHVLSEEQLTAIIRDACDLYEKDAEAIRNRALADVRAAFARNGEKVGLRLDSEQLKAAMARTLRDSMATYFRSIGFDSLKVGILSEVGGEIAGNVLTCVVVRLLTGAAVKMAAAGSAAAGGAVAGGSGGSAFGPAGTIIGLGIGTAVGVAVDWFLTSPFERRVREEVGGFLDGLEKLIVEGDRKQWGGMRALFRGAGRANAEALRRAILTNIQVSEGRP